MTSLGRWWRTVRSLRASQMVALARHRLRGDSAPRPWSGPAPTLRLPSPRVPFLAGPAHAQLEGARRVRLLNRSVDFGDAIDWDHTGAGPLWAYHLHQFDYLRHAEVAASQRAAWIADWIDRHRSGVGWSPHPTSLRTLTWLKLLLTDGALPADGDLETRVRASLGAQLETLASRLERHLLANHYLSNLLALVFGGLALEGPRCARWLAHAAALCGELAEQILPDGAHFERSPMYHALLLESVLDLLNVARAVPQACPPPLRAALQDTAARMLAALRVWTHPDGRIALVGDSAFGIAQEPATLEAYASALGIAAPARPGSLEAAGFARLAAGPFSLLASVGGVSPGYQPGHAHADALSFELCVAGERVVTDTGVAEYVPGEARERSRATRSHATLEIGGFDQAELWAAHRVGGRPRVTRVGWTPGHSLEATCSGWATPATVHRRLFRVEADQVEIRDRLEGRPADVKLVLPLAPDLAPRLDGGRLSLPLASGARLELTLPTGPRWRIERGPYFPEFGLALERAVLVGSAERFEGGEWRFRLREAEAAEPPRGEGGG